MSKKTDCIHHQESWMERHVALGFLLVVSVSSLISYWLFDNLFYGFGGGLMISAWITLRCMAKEVYFATVHRVRGNDV